MSQGLSQEQPMPAPRDTRALNRSVTEEFRANSGQVTNPRLSSIPLVLLTTTGARTGRAHTTPLAYFTDGPDRIFVWASAMAAPAHPAWYRNLVANPQVSLELRTSGGIVESFDGTATTATGAERDRLFRTLASTRPDAAAHQDQTSREIPLVVISYDK
jgi:deazaflavin-dependent oxidoreductase (nitroreductase family)